MSARNGRQTYSIYKGLGGKHGAVQFSLSPGTQQRMGAIFVEITSTIPNQKNKYDWEKKIVMSLNPTDIGKLLKTLFSGEECSLVHDPNAGTENSGQVVKHIKFSSPGGLEKGIIINAGEKSPAGEKTHSVPLDGGEVFFLREAVRAAVPLVLGWYNNDPQQPQQASAPSQAPENSAE